jgi:MarR family transcriptional regulator, lower aerobic nicotinate degradation pathway regulator
VKRLYLASRAVMDSVLRPYDLGSTQWYVLYLLAHDGPTMQGELVRMLQIERATMSGIVAALVRKGLIDQTPDPTDQRQRVLSLTASGVTLWEQLPDPLALIRATAFEGVDDTDLETVVRVLQTATQRLNNHLRQGTNT